MQARVGSLGDFDCWFDDSKGEGLLLWRLSAEMAVRIDLRWPTRLAGCGVFRLRLRLTLEYAGIDQLDAGLTHLVVRFVDIAGVEINPPATVRDDVGLEPLLDGVECAELDTVVGSQPHDVDLSDAVFLQVFAQAC